MKHLFSFALVLMGFSALAQKQIVWFDTGLKVQYGAAGFYNKAIGDSDIYDYKISTGYGFGGKIGINFGYNGLAIDIMRSSAKQEIEKGSTLPTINWTSTDIYLLYRNAKNLGYFEIGPKVAFVSKVEDNISGGVSERTSEYNDKLFSGVIGFGANVIGNDGRFSGILGLRFEYAFNDFVGGSGIETNAPLRDASVYANGYSKSNVAFAGLVFELNWGIGYFGKAQCGGRSKFVMF
ncbi:MAG: hypothetical protein IPM42_03690 [Saprospiraceae bacterium]|nr:hypothetical protein [Saprospiraceae bacterium]